MSEPPKYIKFSTNLNGWFTQPNNLLSVKISGNYGKLRVQIKAVCIFPADSFRNFKPRGKIWPSGAVFI